MSIVSAKHLHAFWRSHAAAVMYTDACNICAITCHTFVCEPVCVYIIVYGVHVVNIRVCSGPFQLGFSAAPFDARCALALPQRQWHIYIYIHMCVCMYMGIYDDMCNTNNSTTRDTVATLTAKPLTTWQLGTIWVQPGGFNTDKNFTKISCKTITGKLAFSFYIWQPYLTTVVKKKCTEKL